MKRQLLEVTEALHRFATSKQPQTILLSGKWGSGKTHFWNYFLTKNASEISDRFKKYAYVSTFGITSLSELRDAVFDNAISFSQLDEGATARSFLENSFGVASQDEIKPVWQRWKHSAWGLFSESESRARRYSKLIQSIPGIDRFGTAFRSAAYLSVNHYLICFDDIERRGQSLSIRELLGLVSTFREQKDCSVVVILNADVLDPEDQLALETFREKVFDYEIVYNPNPRDCAAIVFEEGLAYAESIIRFCEKLSITNIRVLRRIKSVVEAFYPLVQKLESAVLEQLVQSTVLLTWSFNTKSPDVPPYEYIKHLNMGFFIELGEKKSSPEQRAWNAVISDYGYRETDEFDRQICEYLETGLLDTERVSKILGDSQQNAVQLGLRNEVSKAWDIFNSSFDNDQELFISQLVGSLRNAIHWLAAGDISSATKVLRQLGLDKDADEIVSLWIEDRKKHNPEALNLENEPFLNELRDPALLEAMSAAYLLAVSMPSLQQVVQSLATQKGWGSTDEKVIGMATADDFYQLFKAIHERQLPSYVRACLQFEKIAGVSEELKSGVRNAKKALKRIGSEHELNRLRVRRYGVFDD